MGSDPYFRQMLLNGLHGRGSHVNPVQVFEGLNWGLVGEIPDGITHSIWQIVDHMIYWQEFSLALLRNENPQTPDHASNSWTENVCPTDENEWNNAANTFLAGIHTVEGFMDDLEQPVTAREGRSRAEVIGMLVGHNSYHLGQVVLLRQLLGAWPPPSGGDTW